MYVLPIIPKISKNFVMINECKTFQIFLNVELAKAKKADAT